MPIVYLILAVCFNTTASIFGKLYNQRCEDRTGAAILYHVLQMLCVVSSWGILFALTPSFDLKVLPYAVMFGICYSAGSLGLICALTGWRALAAVLPIWSAVRSIRLFKE